MTKALRGMAWNHPRALLPLVAVSAEWSARSGVPVEWDARPLKDFEDQPLEELASRYDLLLIDYPFVEVAATSGLIAPVDDWVDAPYLADQAAHSVGRSYASYTWAGKQWALAIDAACQVSAVRTDLWRTAALGSPPVTWTEVATLAAETRGTAHRVAVPLIQNHAYCAFLAVGIALAGVGFWREAAGFERAAALESLEFLCALVRNLHEMSPASDPIAVSEQMAETDEVLYVPLMFGYSTYARAGSHRHVLSFGDAPRGRSGAIGSILGGVGIAVTAPSRAREQAADLARTLASASVQANLYTQAGGQPGHATAWASQAADAQVGGFFSATFATMRQAFLRPRLAGHRQFQQRAGELIHDCIQGVTTARDCLTDLERLMHSLLPSWSRVDANLASATR